MTAMPVVYGADPDAVVSLAAFVSREWSYGVRISQVVGLPQGGAVAQCGHSDGSEWFVACDRYASVKSVGSTFEDVCQNLGDALRDAEAKRIAADIAEADAVEVEMQSWPVKS